MSPDDRITGFLKQRIGLDAASIGQSAVDRAIRQRLEACGLNTAAYWDRLSVSMAEQQALIALVVVPESWFFRYPESFIALAGFVAKRAASEPGRPQRILSAPCASGEEPYSIVMALLDAGLSAGQFTVDAVDLSPPLLERAQAGVYGRNAFRGEDQSFRDRYFHETRDGFLLHERVRRAVRFRPANLMEPASLPDGPYDVVFCRNVLIYFDVPTQESVLKTLTALTAADGFLFVGPAEASLLSRHGHRPVGLPLSFAFGRETTRPTPSPVVPVARPRVAPVRPAATARSVRPVPAHPVPVRSAPAPVARAAIAADPADMSEIAALANGGRIEEALRLCRTRLASTAPSAAVFYWMGLLNENLGRQTDAIDNYRKALYLEPRHDESLAQLATLLRARGDEAGARRLLARADRRAAKHE